MIVILSRGECPMAIISPVVYDIQWQCHRIEQSPVVIYPVTHRRMMDNYNYIPLDGVWCEVKYPTMTIETAMHNHVATANLIRKTCCSALRHYEFRTYPEASTMTKIKAYSHLMQIRQLVYIIILE
jgi:hypothetical protein